MFRILIDTCVWLDLAKDPKQESVLEVVEELIRLGEVSLIVPRIVLDEFKRNRDRIAKESARSLSAHFRIVKDAIGRVGGNKRRARTVLSHLDDLDHRIPMIGGAAEGNLERIEKLLSQPSVCETTADATLRAAQRAIDKRAPFHRDKNAMADAMLMEIYGDCVRDKTASGIRFAFVTHNKADFSMENGNHKLPHRDFAGFFSPIKSLYFISLPETLRRVQPSLVSQIMLERWTEEPRELSEIGKAIDLLFHQVWYNRHWGLRNGVYEGRIKVVEKETYPRPKGAPETVQRDIWKGALKAARDTERRYGKKNLGPWTDFEWGMVNGKLSALRWVLGDEWDMLDT